MGWADYNRPKNETGIYYCFFTAEDGFKAQACQIVNNTKYQGINVRGDKTVKDFFYGIQSGKIRYAASSGYSELLTSIYEQILSKP